MNEERRKVPLMPPRLEARMAKYGIKMPPFAAVFDRVLVYPIDSADQPTSTAGGLIVPEMMRKKAGAQMGVVVSAGVQAIEQLGSHGIAIGDIVLMARFSEYARAYFDLDGRPHQVFIIQAGEIVASADLKVEFDEGELWYEMGTDGRVQVHERERIDPPRVDIGEGI
jgi:Co-chaperonin GroES (HSP10)